MDGRQEVAPCSEEEIELRACTVVAVEQLRTAVASIMRLSSKEPAKVPPLPAGAVDGIPLEGGNESRGGVQKRKSTEIEAAVGLQSASMVSMSVSASAVKLPNSVQLDWWLWKQGEANIANHPPHHRTLTIFY